MRLSYVRQALAFLSLFLVCNCLNAQIEIKGKVLDANTGEALPFSVVKVKGTNNGVSTDYDGSFALKVASLPVVLEISLVGYESQNIDVASAAKPLSIKLGDKVVLLGDGKQVVEVIGQRITEKAKAAQFTVETMDKLAIKQTASVSFYEGMGALKGVDATTASIGFTVINTRGFNSTSPVRSLQIIDGVDNQAPGLNFSLGNFLGSSELDVLKADLIVGASSAFYGPNAFNGVLSMETKNPFFLKGLSAQVKVGERALNEVAFRYADAFKNKSGHDAFAFKVNMYFLKAYDWVADNYDPVTGTNTGKSNPGRYDAVNRYGDERDITYDYSGNPKPWQYIGVGQFHRYGYNEIDLVDYNTRNIKANAAAHFRLNPAQQENSPELIVSSNFGSGTTVYQGDNRFSLKNILFFQNRLELRKRDKYFFRIYNTREDAGDSYDPYFTALQLQSRYKNNSSWRDDYLRYYSRVLDGEAVALGYPELQVRTIPTPPYFETFFDQAKADSWLQSNQTWLFQAHQRALSSANIDNNGKDTYLQPGTQAYAEEFARITGTDRKNGGTRFYDKSALYHAHGEYHLQPKGLNDLTIGANMRMYTPISNGSIFIDTNGRKITNFEYGIYSGIEKKFGNDKFKFNATIRMDKNQNFDYLFSPAVSLVWKPDSLNFVRLSFSSAIRNPTLNDQYLDLNVGRVILRGNIDGFNGLIDTGSFNRYRGVGGTVKDLVYFNAAPIRPEKVKSLELGYRTTLFGNTFVDMSYYFSTYEDFIGYKIGLTANFDQFGFPSNLQGWRVASNATSTVTTQGFSVGVSHYFAKYYQVAGNYSWNVLNTKTDDPIIPAFNTPEHKFNLSISGRNVEIGSIKNLGFNLNYKWIQGFVFEGSPQFSGSIPTYDLLDGQINYYFPKVSTTVKIGASNMLNKKQFQTYGGPRIGRMAYISLVYDWVKK